MADNKDVQYNFTGSTEGLKTAADSAIQILGSVSRAESNMNGIGSQSLSTFNAIRGVTASISNNIAQMQKQLKEYRKEHGVSISWLINNLLHNYFERLGGKNNG